jgi:hypothetical protein
MTLPRHPGIGVGPRGTKVGDVVCVFKWHELPLILRPDMWQDNIFTLTGEVYVHGIMYGEVLEMEREGIVREGEFIVA